MLLRYNWLILASFLSTFIHAAPAKPKTLLKSQLLLTYTEEELEKIYEGRDALNGISIYRVTYQTVTPDRIPFPIKASGLIIVPDKVSSRLPWISLQHGTVIPKGDAPSLKPLEGIYEASQGFVTLVPDYLGYGESARILHPYLQKDGYGRSGVDFLRAAQSFAKERKIELDALFLQGYSEGGYATLALQKALETTYAGEFPLRASSPNAGPYDMEALALNGLAAETQNPVSTAFITISYARWGKYPVPLDAIFNYDLGILNRLVRTEKFDPKVIEKLPNRTGEFLKADFLEDFLMAKPKSKAAHNLRRLFVESSLNRDAWSPQIPTRFHHCVDDEVISVEFTRQIVAHLKKVGPSAPVSSVLIESPDAKNPYQHGTCPLIGAPVAWFKELLASGKT